MAADPLAKASAFLRSLYTMLHDPENIDIIHFDKYEGRDAIRIKNLPVFREKILPSYFNHKNPCSFVRQLNYYGFSMVHDKSEPSAKKKKGKCAQVATCYFVHESDLFKPSDVDSLLQIKRRKAPKRARPGATQTKEEEEEAAAAPNAKRNGNAEKGDANELSAENDALRRRVRELEAKVTELEKVKAEQTDLRDMVEKLAQQLDTTKVSHTNNNGTAASDEDVAFKRQKTMPVTPTQSITSSDDVHDEPDDAHAMFGELDDTAAFLALFDDTPVDANALFPELGNVKASGEGLAKTSIDLHMSSTDVVLPPDALV